MKVRFPVLDGMRGVAAICVMVMHTTIDSTHPLFQNANTAVDFFFILSGFVLAHSYGDRGTMTFGGFVARRVIRLYPLFILGLIIGTPMLIEYIRINFTDYSIRSLIFAFFANALYLPFFNSGTIFHEISGPSVGVLFPANDPGWSLFLEMFINLFFFVLLAIGSRRLIIVVIVSYAAIIGTGILSSLAKGRFGIEIGGGWGTSNFMVGFPRDLFGFGLGMVLYACADLRALAASAVRRTRGAMVIAFVMIGIVFSMPPIPHVGAVFSLLTIGVISPLFVLFGATLPCGPKATVVADYLGWISYPIYCLHFPIMRGVEILHLKGYHFGVPPFVVSCVVTILVSIVACKFYDEPARRWLMAKLRDRETPKAAAIGTSPSGR